jgi:hypothetical protein
MLVLPSCSTVKEPDPITPITPSFPVFPSPYVEDVSVVTFDDATETVTMPLWYWKAIVRYKIDVDTVEAVISQ